MGYQTRPYSINTRRYLKRILPSSVYLRHFGRHEMMSITIWKDLAKLASAESAVLDIGAYRGEFSVAARAVNPTTRIFAFEPNPASLVELKSIAELRSKGCYEGRLRSVRNVEFSM